MTQTKQGTAGWLVVVVVAAAFTTFTMSHEHQSQQQIRIPNIPSTQGDSGLRHLWKFALEKQGPATVRDDQPPVKTFISPTGIEVVNWVPQDSSHPLYVAKYQEDLHEILLDYMATEEVKPDDPKMTQPGGLEVTNLNGKTLTFVKTATETTVNGVRVENSKVNNDGTVSYTLQRSLFGHRDRVNTLWEELLKTEPVHIPF